MGLGEINFCRGGEGRGRGSKWVGGWVSGLVTRMHNRQTEQTNGTPKEKKHRETGPVGDISFVTPLKKPKEARERGEGENSESRG